METNAFLNSVFPNLPFHSHRHYFLVICFICKPYGNKCVPEFCISEFVLPCTSPLLFSHLFHMQTLWKQMLSWILYFRMVPSIHFVNTFLLTCSYANHMKTNAFLNLCVSECVLPFTSPILVYSLFSCGNSLETNDILNSLFPKLSFNSLHQYCFINLGSWKP